jgi:hypothetical protein
VVHAGNWHSGGDHRTSILAAEPNRRGPCRSTTGTTNRNAEGHGADVVQFEYASEYVKLLAVRAKRLGLRDLSLHASILKGPHTEGELSKVSPFESFVEADYYLAMRAIAEGKGDRWRHWRAWSVVHMPLMGPRFLVEAKSKRVAKQLCEQFGLESVDKLKELITATRDYLSQLFQGGMWAAPPYRLDFSELGTK